MKIVLATRNPGKLREFRALLKDVEFEINPDLPAVEETGATFEENALLKARAAARHTRRWALGEDSGLVVDALDGRPGIYSARYAGDDRANTRKVLEELEGVPDDRRTARYVACIALVDADGAVQAEVRGMCEGRIAPAPRGTGGFGYDPIFFVPSLGRMMAELTPEEKNAVSHRGRAVAALREHLSRLL